MLGLSHAVEPWLAALIIGVALLLIGAGVAAWAKRRRLRRPTVSVVRIHEPVHPAEEQVHPWARLTRGQDRRPRRLSALRKSRREAVPMTTQSGLPGDEKSLGQLVSELSEQGARLVRAEIDLAKAEIAGRAQQLGVGAGLIAAGAVLALYLLAAGIATTIIVLDLWLDLWLAALIVMRVPAAGRSWSWCSSASTA